MSAGEKCVCGKQHKKWSQKSISAVDDVVTALKWSCVTRRSLENTVLI
jgi:hypothetical protein